MRIQFSMTSISRFPNTARSFKLNNPNDNFYKRKHSINRAERGKIPRSQLGNPKISHCFDSEIERDTLTRATESEWLPKIERERRLRNASYFLIYEREGGKATDWQTKILLQLARR